MSGTSEYFLRDNFAYVSASGRLHPRVSVYGGFRIHDDNAAGEREPVAVNQLISSYPYRYYSPEIHGVRLHDRVGTSTSDISTISSKRTTSRDPWCRASIASWNCASRKSGAHVVPVKKSTGLTSRKKSIAGRSSETTIPRVVRTEIAALR